MIVPPAQTTEQTAGAAPPPALRLNVTDFVLAVLLGVGYYLLCEASIMLAAKQPPYPIWLAEGFALGFWFITPGRGRWPQLLAVFTANMASSLSGDASITNIALGSAVNVLQLAGGAWVLEAGRRYYGEKWGGLRRLLVFGTGSAVLVNGCCALLSALVFHFRNGVSIGGAFVTVFVSDGLGLMLMTPLLIAWTDRHNPLARVTDKRVLAEAVLLFGSVAAVSYAIFSMRPDPFGLVPPVFYLGIPFVLWAALRFDLRGATLALTIYSLIAFYFTMRYLGPFSAGFVPTQQAMLQLQGYLAVLIVSTLMASVLMRERRASARQAEAWRKRYDAAMHASSNVVYEIFPDTGRIVWAGNTERAIGMAAAGISTARAWTSRIHPDDRQRVSGLRRRLASGDLPSIDLEYRVRRDDEAWITVGVTAYGVDASLSEADPGEHPGRHIVGFVRDITEKKRLDAERDRLQAELRQAQKMEAIGQLAGGIAHDFNNILTSILGYGELARGKAQPGSVQARHLDTIIKAGERGRVLVSQILTFSRKSSEQKTVVDVVEIADEIVTLVKGSNPHQVEFIDETAPGEARVLGNPTELHQLLMNLVTNGLQAMPDGGRLTIAMSSVETAVPRTMLQASLPAGKYLVISVTDHGGGIDLATQARMFEPFFTTKPTGRGTGLGLSLAMSIAKAHGGGIDLVSKVGEGSTFTVFLPIASSRVQDEPVEERSLPRGAEQRVMLVDDEAPLRDLAAEILAELGYQPAVFATSDEALAAFEREPGRFDALLSDEIMPGLTGTQLAAKLHAVRPDLPIFIITAYGGPAFELRAQQAGVLKVLKKPYRKDELADVLADAFASRA